MAFVGAVNVVLSKLALIAKLGPDGTRRIDLSGTSLAVRSTKLFPLGSGSVAAKVRDGTLQEQQHQQLAVAAVRDWPVTRRVPLRAKEDRQLCCRLAFRPLCRGPWQGGYLVVHEVRAMSAKEAAALLVTCLSHRAPGPVGSLSARC